jgi:exodeoxyribonuclease X
MKILILDTETTGFAEPIEPIEVAHLEISFPSLRIISEFEQSYKPEGVIQVGAMATHHIILEDLVDCPASASYVFPECDYLIGHNINFDWEVLKEPEVKRICTLAIARYLLPDLDSHTQSALMYYFFGSAAREYLRNAHSALADIHNCRMVLGKLLSLAVNKQELFEGDTIEDLYKFSENARIPTKMTFGKHKGELISKVPYDYKCWLLKQADVDPYLIVALKKK